jgi:hypothetical protein
MTDSLSTFLCIITRHTIFQDGLDVSVHVDELLNIGRTSRQPGSRPMNVIHKERRSH